MIVNSYTKAVFIWGFALYVYWYSKAQLWAAYMAFYYRNSLAKLKGVHTTTAHAIYNVKYNGSSVKYAQYIVQNLETGKEYKLTTADQTIKELQMTPFILLQYSHKDKDPEHFTLDKSYLIAGNKICALYVLHQLRQKGEHLDVHDKVPFKLHLMDKDFNRVEVDLHKQYVLLTDCPVGYKVCDGGLCS